MSDGSSTHDEHQHEHHIVPVRTYAFVLLALACLMTLTVWVSFHHFGDWNPFIAVGIAICKAVLIVLIFMNVFFSTKLTKMFVVGGFFFLVILFGLIIIDFVSRTLVNNPLPWN